METFTISVDFSSVRGYNDADGGGISEHCDATIRHLSNCLPLTGGHVDQQLKQLMKELGEAINESLADSEQIAEVVSRSRKAATTFFWCWKPPSA